MTYGTHPFLLLNILIFRASPGFNWTFQPVNAGILYTATYVGFQALVNLFAEISDITFILVSELLHWRHHVLLGIVSPLVCIFTVPDHKQDCGWLIIIILGVLGWST